MADFDFNSEAQVKLVHKQSSEVFKVKNGNKVGRSKNCDVQLPLSNISRTHVKIELSDDIWHVVDLGSTNGTKVNGKKLRPNRPYPLTKGDSIFLGKNEFEFISESSPELGKRDDYLEEKSDFTASKTLSSVEIINIDDDQEQREEQEMEYFQEPVFRGAAKRIFARTIDNLILTIVYGVVTYGYVEVMSEGSLEELMKNQKNPMILLTALLAPIGISTGMFFMYHALFLMRNGQTPGKKMMGLKIISMDGDESISIGKVFMREIVGMAVSMTLGFLNIFMYFFNKERRVLHDFISGTKVVSIGSSECEEDDYEYEEE